MEENIEELNFLKDELKKTDAKIKALGYDKWLDQKVKLWEIREIIKGMIDDELIKPHKTVKYKPKRRKGSFMTA